MSNINGEAEKFYYSLKLDRLDENELYYLSNSLNIPETDNKKKIIHNILNRLEVLQKDEFDKISKIIDNLLNKRKIKKNDDNNNNTKNYNNDNNNGNNNINNINHSKENLPAPKPQIPLPSLSPKPTEYTKSMNSFDFNTNNKHDSQFDTHTESMTALRKEDIYNNNILEIKEQKVSVYDKIFFLYSPEVNLNSKIRFYFGCFCCCFSLFSLSIETIIKIYFANSIFSFIYLFSPLQKEKQIKDFFLNFIELIICFFLFISTKNNRSKYARYSLFYNEIKFLYSILTIKKSFNSVDKKFAELLLVCKKKDEDSLIKCTTYFIFFIIVKISIVELIPITFYNIYIAYYQLALIKLKTFKKLQ